MTTINQNEIFDSMVEYVLVIESYYTISGRIGCILKCDNGTLSNGTKLSDEDGRIWIIQNNLALPNNSMITIKEFEGRNWLHYRLQYSLEKLAKPNVNAKLKVN